MAENIKTGDAVITKTNNPSDSSDGSATDEGGDLATSTSEDFAAPTGADRTIMAGAVGMAGVLGIALAL